MSVRPAAWSHCESCGRDSPKDARGRCLRCRRAPRPGGKFGSVPTRSIHTGLLKQSASEAEYEPHLLTLQRGGIITQLRPLAGEHQERFDLKVYGTPEVTALLEAVEAQSWSEAARCAATVRGSLVAVARYYADFTFVDDRGRKRVKDVKGARVDDRGLVRAATVTQLFRMKARLMRVCHGLAVEPVYIDRRSGRWCDTSEPAA